MATKQPLVDSTARLAELLDRIKTETDPARYDQLATEIRRALDAREVNNGTKAEKRIAPRYRFESMIVIRFSRGVHKYAVRGWARDLSESGLAALVAEQLAIGEQVTLSIGVTSGEKETIPAQVVRQIGTNYGFQFTALSPKQRANILRAFEGHSPCPAF